jgi:hypothetical protein
MKKIIALVLAALAALAIWLWLSWRAEAPAGEILSFDDCAAAGYPIMESYPARCATPDGRSFTQDIGNELQKEQLIRIESPRPTASVSSPLQVRGAARGQWYFEASFPVRLVDAGGREIAVAPAQAEGAWMTTEFVPFAATLAFANPTTATGTLILEKSNASGLPEHDDRLVVPVHFR